MGFYNPIPPFKKEYETPVLCIVYSKPSQEGEESQNIVQFFSDRSEVKIF